jgi:hypothetical protein
MFKIMLGVPGIANEEDARKWADKLNKWLLDKSVTIGVLPEEMYFKVGDETITTKRLGEIRETVDEIYVFQVEEE